MIKNTSLEKLNIKILFFATSEPDYLADSLFHGLRTLLKNRVIDYPKCTYLYRENNNINFTNHQYQLYGRGFTLYG